MRGRGQGSGGSGHQRHGVVVGLDNTPDTVYRNSTLNFRQKRKGVNRAYLHR